MSFPFNRSTDADEFERFRREDRLAYFKSVAVVFAIVGGVALVIYAAF